MSENNQPYKQPIQLEGSNIFSKLIFYYIGPLLTLGKLNLISLDIIPEVPQHLKCLKTYQKLTQQFKKRPQSKNKGTRLFKSLFQTFKVEISYLVICLIITTVCLNLAPVLTNLIITFVQQRQKTKEPMTLKAIGYFVAISLILLVKGFSITHLWYHYMVMAYNMINSLCLMVYNKALNYTLICHKKYQQSDIIGFNQTDMERILWLGYHMTSVIAAPLQIIIGMFILYFYLGRTFIPAIIIILLSFFITYFISKKASQRNQQLMELRDQRVNGMEEMFNFIRFIKVNGLEFFFKQKLQNKRRKQIQSKRKLNVIQSTFDLMFWLYNSIILSAIFATFVILDEKLTTAKAFTTIVLFRIIQYTIIQFPMALTETILAWQSIQRLEQFLQEEQINQQNIHHLKNEKLKKDQKNEQKVIKIINGTFKWQNLGKKQQASNSQGYENIQVELPAQSNFHIAQGENPSIVSQNQSNELRIEKKRIYAKALKNINLEFKKGFLTMIIGDIGAGKSSLLYAIMNQMVKDNQEKVQIYESLAYSAQKPWVMAGTLKQNIMFTSQFSEQRMNKAIHYSCLTNDIKQLPQGLQTYIGQKGINLSGGQKARVSLARVLYSQKNILLLDDILGALDSQVGQFIMKQTINKYLLKNGKTIIMPTHAIKYLKYANEIIILQKGQVKFVGSYNQIRSDPELMKVIQTRQKTLKIEKQNSIIPIKSNPRSTHYLKFGASREGFRKQSVNIDFFEQESLEKQLKRRKKSSCEISIDDPLLKIISSIQLKQIKELQTTNSSSYMVQEQKQSGEMKFQNIQLLIKLSGGYALSALVVLFHSGWIVLSSYANIIIEEWSTNVQTLQKQQTIKQLIWFVSFSVGSSITIFAGILILTKMSEILSNQSHKRAIDSLLLAGLNNFFNRIPSGRIINRLSRDILIIDSALIDGAKLSFVLFFAFLGNIAMSIYSSSLYTLIPLVIALIWTVYLKNYYMKTKLQLTRYQSITNSTILDDLVTSMNGATTIRAFQLKRVFFQNQIKKVQVNKKLKIAKQAVEGWFSIRIIFLALLFDIPVIAFSLFNQKIGAAQIGLVITYTLSLSDQIIELVQTYAKFENQMVSIQRINEYIEVKSQTSDLKPSTNQFQQTNQNPQQLPSKINYLFKKISTRTKLDTNFSQLIDFASKMYAPQSLQVTQEYKILINGGTQPTFQSIALNFKKVSIKYFPQNPTIIEDVSFSIKKKQKIGIIGRTGAGKSTLFNALIRVIDCCEGDIEINGKNIAEYSLNQLRSKIITLIDQDPVVFNASFRENLDPEGIRTEEEIHKILSESGLLSIINQRGGLESQINNNSLSIGEKQLLSICRALMKKTEIVLIDEATANIDVKNDEIIQKIIRQEFKDSTVLTIAHRISTLSQSDKIMVLGNKNLLQFGAPQQLMQKKDGIYRQIIQKSQVDFLN